MSKLIPSLVSTTPPPIGIADGDDNEDDEFGDFTAGDDPTYGCDSFSIPNTPEDSPRKSLSINTPSTEIFTNIPTPELPELPSDEEKTKDHQDKRKNLETTEISPNHDVHSENGIAVPNVPINPEIVANNSENSVHTENNLIINGHNDHNDIKPLNKNEFRETEQLTTLIESMNVITTTDAKDEDDTERPPQLFDEDSEEKEEISETPSNFSISFDDNVICDDDEEDESVSMPIELPNHVEQDDDEFVQDVVQKVVDTCKNIQEFDDFDDEWKQADIKSEEIADKSEDINDMSENFEDCEEDSEKCEESRDGHENDDDFGDFNAFASIPSNPTPQSEEFNVCDNQSNSIQSESKLELTREDAQDNFKDSTELEGATDDFDDFADFSSAPIQFSTETPQNIESSQQETSLGQDGADDDDDFGDFDDYTTSTTSSTTFNTIKAIALLNPDKVYEETEIIFKEMFEPVTTKEDEYKYSDSTLENPIFGQIKDVTDTHALKYQWSKSTVQQSLLKALNIDTRNILYAHGMPMPKFAANLGMTPLEPVKSDILTPTPATPLTPSSDSPPSGERVSRQSHSQQQQNGDIPAAQFDWSASGLANPLDSNQTCTLFDLEQLAASLSLSTSSTNCAMGVDSNHASEHKSNIDEDWDLWLQSVSKEESKPTPRTSKTSDDIKFEGTSSTLQKPPTYDTESVNSLQFPEMTDIEESKTDTLESTGINDDFSDFTSYQSNFNHQTQPPSQSHQINPSAWSGSNMIPLRETYIDDVQLKSDWRGDSVIKSNNHSRKSSYESIGKIKGNEDTREEPGWLKPTILTPVLSHKEITRRNSSGLPRENPPGENHDDFDDFQDFQTSTRVSIGSTQGASTKHEVKTSDINAIGGNLLNPTVMQPTLLEPVKLSTSIDPPQAILWPDPGITDEELARFDMYAKKDGNYPTPSMSLVSSSLSDPPASVSNSKAPETKMSGPGGALMVEKHVVVPANKVILHNEVLLPPNNQVVISKDLVLPVLESSPRKYTPQQKTPTPVQSSQAAGGPTSHNADDDDWSDFVSTQPGLSGSNTSPSKHTNSLTSTISSTAVNSELSLSIPQLRSMQNMQPPSKPPIPVITPRGLVQTKIPTMTPSTPVKSLPQTALHVQPPVDGYQPAIISTQFAAQLSCLSSNTNAVVNNTFSDFLHNGHYPTTSIPAQSQPSPQKTLNGLTHHHDDDEWSDFMSSQPVNTGNHSLYTPTLQPGNLAPSTIRYNQPNYSQPNYIQPNLFTSGNLSSQNSQSRSDWNRNTNGYPSDLPNIITNPVHFQNYPTMNTPTNVLTKKSAATNGILHSKNKKPQNLNVARLPDLDFVAPKTKVFHQNKK